MLNFVTLCCHLGALGFFLLHYIILRHEYMRYHSEAWIYEGYLKAVTKDLRTGNQIFLFLFCVFNVRTLSASCDNWIKLGIDFAVFQNLFCSFLKWNYKKQCFLQTEACWTRLSFTQIKSIACTMTEWQNWILSVSNWPAIRSLFDDMPRARGPGEYSLWQETISL